MSYEDKEQRAERKREPHKDLRENVNEFNRVIKTAWMPTCEHEVCAPDGQPFGNYKISDSRIDSIYNPSTNKHENTSHVTEYKCVTFGWGKKNRFKRSHPISFHQSHYDQNGEMGFCSELIAVINKIKEDCTN